MKPHLSLTLKLSAVAIFAMPMVQLQAADAYSAAPSISVAVFPSNVADDSTAYTRETNEPNINGNATVGKSAWFKFEPTVTGNYSVSTSGSAFDTWVGVYQNENAVPAVDNNTFLVSNDDITTVAPVDNKSKVVFRGVAGSHYYIQVDGKITGPAATPVAAGGVISLTVDAPAAPTNDDFANATAVTDASFPLAGDNSNATMEAGEVTHNDLGTTVRGTVWYQWTPTNSGLYRVNGGDALTGVDHIISVYSGTTLASLTRLSTSNNQAAVTANANAANLVSVTAGTAYYIQVDGNGTPVAGRAPLTVTLAVEAGPAPANDNFASATVISPALSLVGTTVTGDTAFATHEAGEPDRVDNVTTGVHSYSSAWWSITPSTSELINVQTAGSNFDTTLAVYTGSSVSALTLVAGNNDTNGTPQSRVQLPVVAGTTYHIRVDGRNPAASGPQTRGTVSLRVSTSPNTPIIPLKSTWEYYLAATDPVVDNVDWDTTWSKTAEGFTLPAATAYSGTPAFASGAGAFGFDVVTGLQPYGTTFATYGQACYIRKKFTLAAPSMLVASILVDDGAFIYIDGVLVSHPSNPFNLLSATDAFGTLGNASASETVYTNMALNGIYSVGDHIIAVSARNRTVAAGDMGVDVSLTAESRPPVLATQAVLNLNQNVAMANSQVALGADALGEIVPANTFSATGLPAGLAISPLGVISGTPTVTGSFVVQITATNTNGSDMKPRTINVTGESSLTTTGVGTGFESPAIAAKVGARSASPVEVAFVQSSTLDGTDQALGRLVVVDASGIANSGTAPINTPGAAGNASGAKCVYVVNGGDIESHLQTERIAIGSFTKVKGEIDHRNYSTSTSYFEEDDVVHVYLQTSVDGTAWTTLGDVISRTIGTTAAQTAEDTTLGIVTLSNGGVNGGWRTHSTTFDVPVGALWVRMIVNARNDSTAEFLFFDNVKLSGVLSGPVDSDSDGIDDAWETANFGNLTDANANSNWDGDGQSDLAEYLSGTAPKDASDYLHITGITYDAATTMGTVTAQTVSGKTYQLQASDGLSAWASQGSPVPATSASTSFPISAPLSSESDVTKHFFRVILP
jgi:hypothetical protein